MAGLQRQCIARALPSWSENQPGYHALLGMHAFGLEETGDYRHATLIEMFLDLEKRYPVKFYYDPDILPYYQVSYEYTGQTLFNALQTTLPANGLVCIGARENGIMILRKTDVNR